MKARTVPTPVDAYPGASLKHTCRYHPQVSDGPHDGNCVSLCGLKTRHPHAPAKRLVRNGASCLVCDSLYDALVARRLDRKEPRG